MTRWIDGQPGRRQPRTAIKSAVSTRRVDALGLASGVLTFLMRQRGEDHLPSSLAFPKRRIARGRTAASAVAAPSADFDSSGCV